MKRTDRPQRIPLDRRSIGPMLARAARLGGYLLQVETDRHGQTVAYLQRQVAAR
ncbi:MAG: hypothetical protein RLZZ200_2827 [Pseudomonadota bacterium]